MVVGGDFNATTCPRYGYSGLPHIRVADERLIEWSARSRLTCAAPGPSEAMWLSMDESRQTVRVLDCFFFLRSKSGLPCPEDPVALEAADSRLDHRVVQATLTVEGINSILPLEALMRPVRLNMPVRWWREKAEDWRRRPRTGACSLGLLRAAGGRRLLRAAGLPQSRRIQPGQSYSWSARGRMRSFIPFHSSRYIRLQARLRLFKAARRAPARAATLRWGPPGP